MTPVEWPLERLRPVLRMLSRQYALGMRLQARLDGSDLVQEVLLRAHACRDQFRGTTESELLGWMQKILANVFRDEWRKGHADRRDVEMEVTISAGLAASSRRLEEFLATQAPGPDQVLQGHELLVQVGAALEELSEDQRLAVELIDLYGWKTAEVAARLDRTPKAVAGLLDRGRQGLRERLRRHPDFWE